VYNFFAIFGTIF